MSQVMLHYRNILETGTVTSTDENASFPLYRTYDRDIGKLFKFNSHAAGLYIKIDQTAVPYNVNRLIIPVGHNLNGLEMEVQNSSTGAFAGEEVHVLNWTQGDALTINKSFTPANPDEAYWRFFIVGDPAVAPQFSELYLTYDYTFVQNPSYNAQEGYRLNVLREETLSGRVRRVKFGSSRRVRNYNIPYFVAVDKAAFEAWEAVWDGVKYFYITDVDGTLIYMELLNELLFTDDAPDTWSCELQLLEVL